jgi:hypothetical protein
MKDPILVDSLIIGRSENRIEKNFDGSIIFRDALVPGVRLIDLMGGNIVIDPGIYVVIEVADWTLISGLYTVDIPHNWNLCYPTMIDVNIYNNNYELITVDTVKVNTNYVTIKSTINQKMYVSLKKI